VRVPKEEADNSEPDDGAPDHSGDSPVVDLSPPSGEESTDAQ
jgi:hypothetical protein